MCGLVGVLGRLPTPDARTKALATMRHRGPDGLHDFLLEGVWLGHAWLSVTDSAPEARQPIHDTDGRVTLVFNGEIFNHRELRQSCEQAGYRFITRSDTEVVLAAYLCFGESVFERLEGIYGIAIHDRCQPGHEILWLARDAMGVKPMYLMEAPDDYIAFASELRTLNALGLAEVQLSSDSLALLLSSGSLPQPYTAFRSIRTLAPGALLRYDRNSVTGKFSQHELFPYTPFFLSLETAQIQRTIEDALIDAVHRQIEDQSTPHLFLSAGIDSALLCALASSQRKDIHCHTLSLSNISPLLDESLIACRLAKDMGWAQTNHLIDGDELVELFLKFISHIDQPTIDGFNAFLISSRCANLTKVVFSGTGPDELFFGYPWMNQLLGNNYRTTSELAEQWIRLCTIFNDLEIADLLGISASHSTRLRASSVEAADPGEEYPLHERIRTVCLYRFTLDRLLRDIDVAAMSSGLEARVPFLDRTIVEACRGLGNIFCRPGNDRRESGNHAYGGLKEPIVNLARQRLPKNFFNANYKRGFILPYEEYLRGPLHDIASDTFLRPPPAALSWLNPAILRRYWEEFETHRCSPLKIWLLTVLLLWLSHTT